MADGSSLFSRQLQGWICRRMVTRQGLGTSVCDPERSSWVRRCNCRALCARSSGILILFLSMRAPREATRVHHACRWRRARRALGGTRAAGAGAADWRAGREGRGRPGSTVPPPCEHSSGLRAIGLDRRSTWKLTTANTQALPKAVANMRTNLSRSPRMYSFAPALQAPTRYCERRIPCQSSL